MKYDMIKRYKCCMCGTDPLLSGGNASAEWKVVLLMGSERVEMGESSTPTRTLDPPHTPANACCFCWCCCCSCSWWGHSSLNGQFEYNLSYRINVLALPSFIMAVDGCIFLFISIQMHFYDGQMHFYDGQMHFYDGQMHFYDG